MGSVQRVKTRAIGDSQLKVITNMNICSENKRLEAGDSNKLERVIQMIY